MTIDETAQEMLQLAKEMDSNFLQLSKLLRELHNSLTDEGWNDKAEVFDTCLKKAGIGRRRAYYLMDIDRVFGPMNISKRRLSAIGWTKLGLIAKRVGEQDIEGWLTIAETSTAAELRAFLSGNALPSTTITLKLTEKQFDVIADMMMAFGAHLTIGKGLVNREKAMLKMVDFIRKAKDEGFGES